MAFLAASGNVGDGKWVAPPTPLALCPTTKVAADSMEKLEILNISEKCFFCDQPMIRVVCPHTEHKLCKDCDEDVYEDIRNNQWCEMNSHF